MHFHKQKLSHGCFTLNWFFFIISANRNFFLSLWVSRKYSLIILVPLENMRPILTKVFFTSFLYSKRLHFTAIAIVALFVCSALAIVPYERRGIFYYVRKTAKEIKKKYFLFFLRKCFPFFFIKFSVFRMEYLFLSAFCVRLFCVCMCCCCCWCVFFYTFKIFRYTSQCSHERPQK